MPHQHQCFTDTTQKQYFTPSKEDPFTIPATYTEKEKKTRVCDKREKELQKGSDTTGCTKTDGPAAQRVQTH